MGAYSLRSEEGGMTALGNIEREISECEAELPDTHPAFKEEAERHIARLLASKLMAVALEAMIAATESWNKSVQQVIGRQAKTGIDLQAGKEALRAFEGAFGGRENY